MVKPKLRLMARCLSETFGPIVSSSCVRLISAIACECDLDYLCHFEVDHDFVQSDCFKRVFLCDCLKDTGIVQEM